GVGRTEPLLHHSRSRKRINAFVHPRVLELIGRNNAVPELMAGFVDGDVFGILCVRWHQPLGTRGDERRVLHSVRIALPCRIDDGEMSIWIRTEPLAVILERGARGLEMSI